MQYSDPAGVGLDRINPSTGIDSPVLHRTGKQHQESITCLSIDIHDTVLYLRESRSD